MEFGFDPKVWFDGVVDTVQEAETLGYDSVWATEHLVTEEGNFWPSPMMRLAGLATATEDMGLVTSVVVLPLHNLLDVAVNAAVLDAMSNGRLTVGVALGYVPEEFEIYGVSLEDRAGRFVEGLRVLDLYLSSEDPISFDGNFVSFEGVQPHPISPQDPRPELRVGGWGEMALKRAIRLADGWIPGPTADLDALKTRQERLKEIAENEGRSWADVPKPISRDVVIAESSDDAWTLGEREIYPGYAEEYGSEEWSHPVIDAEAVADFETLAKDRFLIGTPDEIIDQLETTEDTLDVDEVKIKFHYTSQDNLRSQLRLFADEVMPSFV